MERLFPRWFVRWLDADMSYLISGGGWSGTAQAVGVLTGLATAFVFAHFAAPSAYGTYKYILASAALLAIPTLSGMNTAVLQSAAKGEDGTVAAAFWKKFRFGSLTALASFALGAYYLAHGNTTLGYSFLAVGFFSPLSEALTVAQSVLVGKRRFDLAAQQSILTSLLSAGSVIGAVLLTNDPLWIILAYLTSNLLGRAITEVVSRPLLENSIVSEASLSFGMHASGAGILAILAGNIDVFALWHSAGAETLALYAFALAAISPFQSLVKSAVNLAHPKFAAQGLPSLILSTKRRAKQAFFLFVPLVIAAVIALPVLFRLLFPAYIGAAPYAQVMMLSVLLYSDRLYGIALTAARRSRDMYAISIMSALSRLVTLSIFIPLWGAWGAVTAVLTQQLFSFLTTRFLFYRMVAAVRADNAS